LKDSERTEIQTRFRRALLAALRDGEAVSGFPALREVCAELEQGTSQEAERRVWHLAESLCAALADAAVDRSPDRLLMFRELDRILVGAPLVPDAVDDLISRLAERLPRIEESSATQVPPPAGVATTIESLSHHPAWEDETAQAAREALASLAGTPSPEPAPNEGTQATGRAAKRTSTGRSRGDRKRSTLADEGRLTPLANVLPRLQRILRLGCQTLDRRCTLDLEGSPRVGQILLKLLMEPFETILRNALYFGVAPDRPTTASMVLRVTETEGSRRLELETDGVSPDLARIAMEALHEGTPPGSTSGIELLLDESRSTADHATRLRGYGAGLIEAQEALEDLGAQLSMELPRDAGLRFVIHLPRLG